MNPRLRRPNKAVTAKEGECQWEEKVFLVMVKSHSFKIGVDSGSALSFCDEVTKKLK